MMRTSGVYLTKFGVLAITLSNKYLQVSLLPAIPYSTTIYKNIKMFFAKFINNCLYLFSMPQSQQRSCI